MLNFTCRRYLVEQSIHFCIYAYAECGGNLAASVRLHWREGGSVSLGTFTIAMVDMINVLFGTTTCLDDKGNPPFFLFFFFFFFVNFFLEGKCVRSRFKESVGAQEKRMKGTKGTNELQC